MSTCFADNPYKSNGVDEESYSYDENPVNPQASNKEDMIDNPHSNKNDYPYSSSSINQHQSQPAPLEMDFLNKTKSEAETEAESDNNDNVNDSLSSSPADPNSYYFINKNESNGSEYLSNNINPSLAHQLTSSILSLGPVLAVCNKIKHLSRLTESWWLGPTKVLSQNERERGIAAGSDPNRSIAGSGSGSESGPGPRLGEGEENNGDSHENGNGDGRMNISNYTNNNRDSLIVNDIVDFLEQFLVNDYENESNNSSNNNDPKNSSNSCMISGQEINLFSAHFSLLNSQEKNLLKSVLLESKQKREARAISILQEKNNAELKTAVMARANNLELRNNSSSNKDNRIIDNSEDYQINNSDSNSIECGDDAPCPPPAAPPLAPPLSSSASPNVSMYLSKPKIVLPAPVKQIHWTPLKNDELPKTVWGDVLAKLSDEKFDLDDIVKHFGIASKSKKSQNDSNNSSNSNNSNSNVSLSLSITSALDANRANSVKISSSALASKLKFTDTEIKSLLTDRIKEWDEQSEEAKVRLNKMLDILTNLTPTEQESKLINQVPLTATEKLSLPTADKILLVLTEIPRAKLRVELIAFKGEFDSIVHQLKEDLMDLSQTAKDVMKSKGLQKMLHLILSIGNVLNANKSNSSQLFGYKISVLPNLVNIKMTNSNQSLLHYLVNHVKLNHPERSEWFKEIPKLNEKIAGIERNIIDMKIKALEDTLFQAAKEVERVRKSKEVQSQKFAEMFFEFCEKSKPIMLDLKESYNECINNLTDLEIFFGEPKENAGGGGFQFIFQTLFTFSQNYQQALLEWDQRKLLEDKASAQASLVETLHSRRSNLEGKY